MPFVKLDCGILNSTIWLDRTAREVFITSLLLAEPQEFDDPVPQIRVRNMELTGWAAPKGWYGFVPAAGVGILAIARVDTEDGLTALERMGEPEADSRSQEYEGRRMIRINGGYLILNYDKYREKDYTAAERQRRYRVRQMAKRNAVTSRDVNTVTRNITQAEADSEAKAFKSSDKSVLKNSLEDSKARVRANMPNLRVGPKRYS